MAWTARIFCGRCDFKTEPLTLGRTESGAVRVAAACEARGTVEVVEMAEADYERLRRRRVEAGVREAVTLPGGETATPLVGLDMDDALCPACKAAMLVLGEPRTPARDMP